MKLFCTCSSDTYITDRIIDDNRSHNSNSGRAGTLDLFKLWGETPFRGTDYQNEVSRILMKFDFSNVKNRLNTIDIGRSDFKARLKMFDITAGNAVPSNFNVFVAPLSQSFQEGFGRSVSDFSDLYVSNFLTASIKSGNDIKWFLSGANAVGDLGASNVDYVDFADLSDGLNRRSVIGTQYFKDGTEDLSIDITTMVSASISGQIVDNGYRISFSGSDDSDKKSRFVKRFASRHVANPHLRPYIEISFDDSVSDNHLNFVFNKTGSLYLENVIGSQHANIVSGSNLAQVVGANCMNLRLESKKFSFSTPVSQVFKGINNQRAVGIYSASFCIDTFNDGQYDKKDKLKDKIARDGSVNFRTYWESTDGTHVYRTGSLEITKANASLGSHNSDFELTAINLSNQYSRSDFCKISLFGKENSQDFLAASKKKLSRQSLVFENSHYRLVDYNTGKVIFDFDEIGNSTKISSDSNGMYFNFDFSVAAPGHSYTFEYLIKTGHRRLLVKDKNARFSVV